MNSCMSAGDLQQYLDGIRTERLRSHLADCARCGRTLARMAETNRRVDAWLSVLTLSREEQPDVSARFEKMVRRLPVSQAAATWVSREHNLRPRYISVAIHAAALSLLMFGASNPAVQNSIRDHFNLIDPALKPWVPDTNKTGGGGGGARESEPVSRGRLPKPALKQFVPPTIVDRTPQLALTPTIVAPPDTLLPQSNLGNWGDPLAALLGASNGQGFGGGMGDGSRGGVGTGTGIGYGPGSELGADGGVFRAGGNVSAPVVVYQIDPEYSEEARKAKFSGSVILAVIVDKSGRVRDARVVKSLGMGLDEKAMDAVQQWKFRPGTKDGRPVNVLAQVVVNFRLL